MKQIVKIQTKNSKRISNLKYSNEFSPNFSMISRTLKTFHIFFYYHHMRSQNHPPPSPLIQLKERQTVKSWAKHLSFFFSFFWYQKKKKNFSIQENSQKSKNPLKSIFISRCCEKLFPFEKSMAIFVGQWPWKWKKKEKSFLRQARVECGLMKGGKRVWVSLHPLLKGATMEEVGKRFEKYCVEFSDRILM